MKDDNIVTVWVVASEGRTITEYGSREYGESFDLPASLAKQLTKEQPGAFSAKDPRAPEKKEAS